MSTRCLGYTPERVHSQFLGFPFSTAKFATTVWASIELIEENRGKRMPDESTFLRSADELIIAFAHVDRTQPLG